MKNFLKKVIGVALCALGVFTLIGVWGAQDKFGSGEQIFVMAIGIAFLWGGWKLIKSKKSSTPKKLSEEEKILAQYAGNTKEAIEEELESVKDADIKTKAAAVGKLIRRSLEDGVLDKNEEEHLNEVIAKLGISLDDIAIADQRLLGKGLIVRDLLEGNVKPRVNVTGLPFKFMKSEVLVWAFQPVHISEIKTVSAWQSGQQGVSLRLAKGVYWHLGKTQGHRVERQELKDLGSGIVAVTSKHIYMLTGSQDSMRIRHDKIVSIVPDTNGAIIYREGARSNPLLFECDDPWFFLNVVQNASNWDA